MSMPIGAMPPIPTEFSFKGNRYQIKHMDAVKQFFVAQKIAPLVIPIISVAIQEGAMKEAQKIVEEPSTDETEGRNKIFNASIMDIQKVAVALQAMPEADMKYIFRICLSHLYRQGGEGLGWSPVWNVAGDMLQFQDLAGFDLMVLCFEVVKDQLENFMSGALSLTTDFGLPPQTTNR